MEGDNQYLKEREKPSNKLVWWFLLTIALIVTVGVVMYHNHDSIAKLIIPEKECVAQDTAYAVVPVLTVQEVLDFRKEIKEGQRVDSIFLAIPDVILIDILMTHGTSLSNSDIVYIYESNKSRYKDVLKGAVIQKNINLQKETVDIPSIEYTPRDSLKRELSFIWFYVKIRTYTILVRENRYSLQKMTNLWGVSNNLLHRGV